MREILQQALASIDAGRPVAYCRLVETRGSTPQKAGAVMLVFADGSQAGTLGGGCVEAEVKRRALAILDSGQSQVAQFQLDSDYGWDDGLICGGRMQVLIDPLTEAGHGEYLRDLSRAVVDPRGCIEAVIFDAQKSGLPVPRCYLFDSQGQLLAHVGTAANQSAGANSQNSEKTDGNRNNQNSDSSQNTENGTAVPRVVRDHLPLLGDRPRPSAVSGVAYLPTLGRCRLLVVGAGHIGQAVANWAADLDFNVWVVDDRADIVTPERFPRAERLIHGPIGPTLSKLEITPDTYCLIVTRGHNHDEEALYHLIDRDARYVGLIGSKRKIRLIFDDLLNEGISMESLSGVFAPLGIHIGSQTVPEIAVSILAELISHRNRDGIVPGRPEGILLGPESEGCSLE
jgi:xanthine dehydrogenase accessory factor